MKAIFFASMVIIFLSCKKESQPPLLNLNNQVIATINLSSGDIIKINATGSKALMGCSYWTTETFIDGTNESNAAVYMSIYDNNFQCIDNPGTYNFTCEYRPDVMSQTAPIYSNIFSSNQGTITFTVRKGHDAEGYFNAVCKANTDSVIVQGTFKGYIE